MYKLTDEQKELIKGCSLFRMIDEPNEYGYNQVFTKGEYVNVWISEDYDTGIPYDLSISTTGTTLKNLGEMLICQKELSEAICFCNKFKATIKL